MFFCLALGFVGGIVVGAIVQRNGYLRDLEFLRLPEDYYNYEAPNKGPNIEISQPRFTMDSEENGDLRCIVHMTSHNVSGANCGVCSNSR